MKEKYLITNSELEIMKVLWKLKDATLPQIDEEIRKNSKWSKSTIKTLLSRLIKKGTVNINSQQIRNYRYTPAIRQDEYIEYENKSFLEKIYNGSINNMLLNFVKNEKLTKEDLQNLIDLINKEES